MTSPTALADAARDVAAGTAGGDEFHQALLSSTVYCERGELPGFEAMRRPGGSGGTVPIFSSPEQLALARGTVGWFSLTGTDLLDLLPTGFDLLLDLGGPAPLRINTAALDRVATIEVELDEPSTT